MGNAIKIVTLPDGAAFLLYAGEIVDFIKQFNVHYGAKECINLLTNSAAVQTIAKTYKAPIDNYYLSHLQIERMMHP